MHVFYTKETYPCKNVMFQVFFIYLPTSYRKMVYLQQVERWTCCKLLILIFVALHAVTIDYLMIYLVSESSVCAQTLHDKSRSDATWYHDHDNMAILDV